MFFTESENRGVCGVEEEEENKDNLAVQKTLRLPSRNNVPTITPPEIINKGQTDSYPHSHSIQSTYHTLVAASQMRDRQTAKFQRRIQFADILRRFIATKPKHIVSLNPLSSFPAQG